MSQAKIRSALEKTLYTLAQTGSPIPQIAWENLKFTPVTNVLYLRSNLIPVTIEDPSIGGKHQRRFGIYQVSVCTPQDGGIKTAEEWAEKIVEEFPRGLQITKDSIVVNIDKTPSVAAPLYENGWAIIPVRVNYRVDIITI